MARKHEKLRDLAVTLVRARGRTVIDGNGTCARHYADHGIRIVFTPPIVGSSNPSMVEVWDSRCGGAMVPVLSVMWSQWGEDVLTYVGGDWEKRLSAVGGKAKGAKIAAFDTSPVA